MRYAVLALVLLIGLGGLLFGHGSGERRPTRAAPQAAVIGLLGDTIDGHSCT